MEKFRKSGTYRTFAAIVVFSLLIALFGFIPETQAASLSNAKDTLSDSSPSAQNITHTFSFVINTNIPANGDIYITFDNNFTLSGSTGDITCPSGGTASTGGQTVTCSTSTQITATTSLTVIVRNVDSPAKSAGVGVADTYSHTVQTRDATDVVIESSQVRTAVIESVTMSGSVNATLAFEIRGVATSTVINNATTTRGTATTSIPFGTISAGAANFQVAGQELSVTTNADYGFIVTVQQDNNLQSAAGSDIDSFKDGTPQTTPAAWTSPTGTLANEDTYGHMGLTSNDSNLSTDGGGYPNFSGGAFGGLNGTSTFIVFANTGPADGSTQNSGLARVAYKVEIHALQEAGDYTNTLTYICTPSY